MLLGDGKARNVACIIWLEELQALKLGYWDLAGYLQSLAVPIVISPLHDRDRYTPEDVRKWLRRNPDVYDEETGEIAPENVDRVPKVNDAKKAHIHVMVRAAGPKCAADFSALFEDLGLNIASHRWEKVEHVESMIRYFAHLDQPDKARYSAFDVLGFGGIDLSCLLKTDVNSKVKVLCEVQELVLKNGIKYFHELSHMAFKTKDLDYINCVTGRSGYWIGYFNSVNNKEIAAHKKRKEVAENNA